MGNIVKSLFDNFKYIIILIIVLLIIQFLTPISNSISSFFDRLAPPATASVVLSQTLITSIKSFGDLVTESHEADIEDVRIEVNKGRLEAYGASHRVTGIIEAGINFEEIGDENVKYNDERDYFTLVLPSATITSCRILDIEQYDWSITVLQAPWDKVRQLAQHVSSLQFAEDMLEAGILEKAEEKTKSLLGNFVISLTGKQVVFNFKARTEPIDLHDFCDLEPPSGWAQTEDGGWIQT